MLFKVLHIDPTGRRRRAHVTAASTQDAMGQMDQAFGMPRAASCVRVAPGLRPVRAVAPGRLAQGVACGC